MAASGGERRLFVGGLGPTVTQDDVRAQLSRFGAVSSVELVSRVDVLGNPEKTFAYVNVALSEAALQRCEQHLGSSPPSRLAKERQQAKAKQEQQFSDGPTAGSETSLGKNGILEFHMKAVPGTEVPGHKDWVVSKFGRVLPVLHLRSQNKRKILKYDPSKYCHNLKKFEQDVTNTVSISDLTWKLEGGDDTMSKKRQGQFPAFRNCPPKRAKVGGNHCSPAPPNVAQQPDVQKADLSPVELPTSGSSRHKNSQKPETVFLPASKSPFVRSRNTMSDDDIDSEDELKAMIAEEKKSQKMVFETDSTERDSFEVVSSDFKPSPASSGVKHKRTQASCSNSSHPAESDKEYDSGDTDEIIAGGKNGDQSKNKAKTSPKRKAKPKEKKDCLQNRTDHPSSGHATEIRKGRHSSGNEKESSTKLATKKLPCTPPESEDGSEENLDYDSMMTNCYRLDLTLADLEKLASEGVQKAEDSDDCTEQDLPRRQVPDFSQKKRKASNRRAQCINPSDILASLLEGEEISDRKPPQENMWKSKFQAFKGVGALYEGETLRKPFRDTGGFAHKKGHSWNQEASANSVGKQAFGSNTCSSEEMFPPQDGRETNEVDGLAHCPGKAPRKRQASRDQCSTGQSSTPGSECENGSVSSLSSLDTKKTHRTDLGSDAGMRKPKQGKSDSLPLRPSPGQEPKPVVLKTHAKKPIQVSVERVSAFSRMQGKAPRGSQEETNCPPPQIPSSDAISPPKNSQDNQKRLAALEERKRERELQKQLVRSALSSVDSSLASKPTHIVFGSDSEEETEEKGGSEQPLPENRVKQDLTGKTSGKLFESSEDDEQESDDDEARFQIKPQFEGKAGKKLMNLQSHFGTDDRFRMDARFLESESEEEEEAEEPKKAETNEEAELIAEKKKNLDMIQNLLHIGHPTPKLSKEEMAAKQFRNIVRYDPTRLDHATFERKTDPEEKESKARRRKKREEAEKLPEVSKDLYHSIAADLKDRFRATEPAPGGTGATGPWNETPEELETTEAPSAGLSEFTFSFFGPDSNGAKEEPYKIEARAPGRMAWQQDPRFQDSSSEEEEEEEVEPDDGSREAAGTGEVPLPEKPARRFFFFSENDERLGVGPESFWQGSGSRASSEDWESRTMVLLQDCRKKHKAAKRKAKP
ncbi:nucleolar protein 8 isoform X2 [Monodelphis domestica]|uniref:nucleolar protein 8 isoform X2 n=1 Tax=Monodelphis domestica TaxID=13616 RepID=UPI0004435AA4|nr:nucleolar protein 8 isoform X2 [Monodelphis domestica]